MKVALYLGCTIFCSIWTTGLFRQCYVCPESKSFEDCQSKQKLDNCSDASDACFQTSVKYDNGSYKGEAFDSGCLVKSDCDRYKKGDIGFCNDLKDIGFTVECISECCHEDGCNKGNLLAENKGAFLQCSSCQSFVSLEDCQNKSIVQNCSGSANDYGCFQQDIKYEKGSDKTHGFQKGCLTKKDCEDYIKGEIRACILQKAKGYETDCKAICCHEDECNKENLLPQDKDNKGSAFAISVMMLLSGLLLTLVNIN